MPHFPGGEGDPENQQPSGDACLSAIRTGQTKRFEASSDDNLRFRPTLVSAMWETCFPRIPGSDSSRGVFNRASPTLSAP